MEASTGAANVIYLKPSGRRYYLLFFLAFATISAVLLFATPLFPFNVYQAVFALLVLASIASGVAFLYFQRQYIYVEDEMITVREGIFTSRAMMIPFSNVVEIKTQYTLVDSILGVGTVMIDTAGTAGVEVVFSNIPRQSIINFLSLFRHYKQLGEARKKGHAVAEGKQKPERDNW